MCKTTALTVQLLLILLSKRRAVCAVRFGYSLRDQLGGKSNANRNHSEIHAQKYKAHQILKKIIFCIILRSK